MVSLPLPCALSLFFCWSHLLPLTVESLPCPIPLELQIDCVLQCLVGVRHIFLLLQIASKQFYLAVDFLHSIFLEIVITTLILLLLEGGGRKSCQAILQSLVLSDDTPRRFVYKQSQYLYEPSHRYPVLLLFDCPCTLNIDEIDSLGLTSI